MLLVDLPAEVKSDILSYIPYLGITPPILLSWFQQRAPVYLCQSPFCLFTRVNGYCNGCALCGQQHTIAFLTEVYDDYNNTLAVCKACFQNKGVTYAFDTKRKIFVRVKNPSETDSGMYVYVRNTGFVRRCFVVWSKMLTQW